MILRKMNTNNKGFSLVELMIVVAIIGLLAAIGVPQYAKFQARARQSEAKASLGALYSAQQSFLQEWNTYSVSIRNIGFGVTGQNLRYVTGFAPGACTNYNLGNPGAPAEVVTAAGTLSNAGGVAADINAMYPDANTRPTFFTTAAAPIATKVTVTGSVCSNVLFTGSSEGDPKNTPTGVAVDRWTINQAKLISNPLVGL